MSEKLKPCEACQQTGFINVAVQQGDKFCRICGGSLYRNICLKEKCVAEHAELSRSQPEAATNAGDVGKSRSVGDAVSFQAFNLASQLATAEADLAKAREVIQGFSGISDEDVKSLIELGTNMRKNGYMDSGEFLITFAKELQTKFTTARNYLNGGK